MDGFSESDSESAEGYPTHAGTEKGFTGQLSWKKKDRITCAAERRVIRANGPDPALEILCMDFHQNIQCRTTLLAVCFDLDEPYNIEAALIQSRADRILRGTDVCKYCQDGRGPFKTCNSVTQHRAGCCGNCMASGGWYNSCSLVPDVVKKMQARVGVIKNAVPGLQQIPENSVHFLMNRVELHKSIEAAFTNCAKLYSRIVALEKEHTDAD
ncbi:MAG: hypothetical protein Q9163_005958 [Psora crenata]